MPSQNSMVYLSDKDTSKSVGDRSVDTDQIEFDAVWCQVVDGDFEVLLDIAVVNSLVEGTYKVWYILAWILPNPKHYWFPGTGEDNRCHSPMIYKFEPCRLNSNVIQRTLYTRSRSTMTRVRSSSTFSGNWTPGMLLVQEKKVGILWLPTIQKPSIWLRRISARVAFQHDLFDVCNMTRATEALTTGTIAVVVYLILFFGLLPLPDVIQNKIVPVVQCAHPIFNREHIAHLGLRRSYRGGHSYLSDHIA